METSTVYHAGLIHNLPKRKILFVDEDIEDLQSALSILRVQGHDVIRCRSYAEGADLVGRETFDFIIVGQGSSRFEGRKVLQRVMEVDRRIPVLVLTRCLDMSAYIEAMQLGALDYLEKPVAPLELMRLIAMHLRPAACAASS